MEIQKRAIERRVTRSESRESRFGPAVRRSGGDSVAIGIYSPSPLTPPSLISLVLSVDVKHRVHLLNRLPDCGGLLKAITTNN